MYSHDFSLGRVVLSEFLTIGIPYNKQGPTKATTLVRDSNVQLERIESAKVQFLANPYISPNTQRELICIFTEVPEVPRSADAQFNNTR